MTDHLNLVQVASAQSNRSVTQNDKGTELAEALADFATVLVDNTNARTLTATEWTRNMQLSLEDDSPVPTAAVTITVPTTTARGIIVVRNQLSFDATVTISGQAASAPVIAAGEVGVLTSDGTNVVSASVSSGAMDVVPVEKSQFIPVEGHITPTAAGGCAALATVASGANLPDITSLDFDQTTAEHAQLKHIFEKPEHAGNVSFQFVWSHAGATTFGVQWNAKGASIANDVTIGTAFGVARAAEDAGGTTDDLYVSEKTGFVKVLDMAQSDLSIYDFFRDPTATVDDLDVDARLMGVIIYWWEENPLDTEWANVELLFGADGVDTDTTVDDESDNAHVATYAGNAQCDTAESKFSKSSLLMDGTGDYVTFADEADFDLGAGNFCMEGWFQFNALTAAASYQMMGKYTSSGNQRSYALFYLVDDTELNFLVSTAGTAGITKTTFIWTPTLNQWYHIAVDYDGTTYRCYVDGVLVDSDVSSETVFNSSGAFAIGAQDNGTFPFNGWADDVRLTKASRYPAAFTPPTAPFPRG